MQSVFPIENFNFIIQNQLMNNGILKVSDIITFIGDTL